MRRSLSLRLHASLTMEVLYAFSPLSLSLTAATRFVYREQARCTVGPLLEDLVVQTSRAGFHIDDIATVSVELKSHYLCHPSSPPSVDDSHFIVWHGPEVDDVELCVPRFSACIEYKLLCPETALHSTSPLPDSTKEVTP